MLTPSAQVVKPILFLASLIMEIRNRSTGAVITDSQLRAETLERHSQANHSRHP